MRYSRFSLMILLLSGAASCHKAAARAERGHWQAAPAPPVRGPVALVTNEDSNDVTVIDTGSDIVIDTIPVGKRPRGIRLAPDGKTVYVALSGSPKVGPG